jgi:hypothetical protein
MNTRYISIDFFPEAILEDMLANRLLGGSFANDWTNFYGRTFDFVNIASGFTWMILIFLDNPNTCNQHLPPLFEMTS